MKYVVPSVSSQYQLIFGNQNWKTTVQGVPPEFLTVRDYKLAAGRFCSTGDDDSRARVAVLGQTVVTNLFGNVNPVGQTIRVGQAPFRVIGVLAAKGQSSMGQDQDDLVLVPLKTAQERLLGITYLHNISVQIESESMIDKAQTAITALLRTRHHLPANVENDFSVRNMTALMSTMQETTSNITAFLGGIGRHFARRRRHRHHEHHARLGDRADEGDRHQEGARRHLRQHPHAVSHRGGRDQRDRRPGGHRGRRGRGRGDIALSPAGVRSFPRTPSWRLSACRFRSACSSGSTRPARPRCSTRSRRSDTNRLSGDRRS